MSGVGARSEEGGGVREGEECRAGGLGGRVGGVRVNEDGGRC